MIRWIKRKPFIRWIAKKRLLNLQKQYRRFSKQWEHHQTNMHIAALRLLEARITYYEKCFLAWGKYRPEFSFDEQQLIKYENELKELQIPFRLNFFELN